MNPDLELLHPYPFEKLAQLFRDVVPADKPHIALSIGEPQHPAPDFVRQIVADNTDLLAKYPSTQGIVELREAIADWLCQRFGLKRLDVQREVLPVNGTREALFAFAQALLDRQRTPLVLMPNPFYQIYEGAALLAGGQPVYLPCTASTGFQPDFDAVSADTWTRCQLLYICSPGNPTGAVLSIAQMQALISLADKYDFIIASDECYSEIYDETPPPGLLEACADMGRHDYRRCVVFHSLSKRSTCRACVPGLLPAMARSCSASCVTAPITAVPCRCTTSWPALRRGVTRRMWRRIAASTARSLPPCWISLAMCLMSARRMPASTCGRRHRSAMKSLRAS